MVGRGATDSQGCKGCFDVDESGDGQGLECLAGDGDGKEAPSGHRTESGGALEESREYFYVYGGIGRDEGGGRVF